MVNQSTQQQMSSPPGRAAWLPIPLLLLIIVALWGADWRTSYESPYLRMGLNFVFLTLGSLWVAGLVARSFLAAPMPGLLLLGSGALLWGAAGLAGSVAALIDGGDSRFDANVSVTLYNICAWLAACCHLAGAACSLRWRSFALPAPRLWLAGAGAAVLGVTGFVVLATLSAWLPVFFVAGSGATPVRQLVLGSAIAMLVLTAAMLREEGHPSRSAFVGWYSLALLLLAAGLFGVMIQPSVGSVLGWVGRATQYLGGGYLLTAALVAARMPGGLGIAFGAGRLRALHRYGIAVAIVVVAATVRLIFMPSLGTRIPLLTFYPAVMLAALYAGFGAGVLATVLSVLLADYFWIEPASPLLIRNTADLLAMAVFTVSSIIVSWVVESMQRALQRALAAELEQRRLNHALRLLSDCNIALVRARSEGQLLDELCRLVVESGGYLMGWVGIAEHDAAKSVRPVAQSGYEEGYLQSIRVSWDGAQDIGRGPTGTAIRSGCTQVCQCCLSNPQMAPWRAAASKRGYQACVGLPLVGEQQVLGALTLYAAEPDTFGVHEVRLLEELASNMAYGLQSLRAHSELERYRQQLEQLVRERTQEIAALNAELERKAQDAESANGAKSAFLATMSHEIRTPLNAVVGMAGLLVNSPLDRRQRDYADKIQLSAQALSALIDDILDFSKIEAGALRLERAPFSLHALLRTMAAVLSVGARGKAIEILFDVTPGVPDALIGDALRLQQILLNLASNAVKFTAAGAIVLSVRCLAQADGEVTLQFAVRDTGIGIAPEQLGRIFEVFTQADSSTSRQYGGTGLGLAISARLADLMGSRIEVDSTLAEGSKFRFRVTLAVAGGEPAAPPPEALSGLRVLIVEDHPLARRVLQQTCAAFGWSATAADSGAAGLGELRRSAAEGREYDLLLLDWQMPDMGGVAMLRQAYATPEIRLPLVLLMVPTFELEQVAAACDDLHLDGVVTKPMTPSSLFEAVTLAYAGEKIAPTPGKTDRRLAGMRLLVAEDNELNQQVIEQVLSRAGAEVVLAANGFLAAQALQAPGARFDAVLMDIQMPVMDGYTATRVIREGMGLVDLPIIAVTAHAQPEQREKFRTAGMVGYLVKPLDVEDLLDLVAEGRRGASNQAAAAAPGVPAVAASHLPGLAVAAALQDFGGDEKKYAEILCQFAVRHGADVDEARRLYQAGDSSSAARLVHELSGVASFLQAREVARLAAATETVLRDGDAGSPAALFNQLQDAMHTLGHSIERFVTGLAGG